ncbi:MAG: hypothetical protein EXR43_04785 [Dehalococcoidia bacterium]|nr:hypothetical protein [Dehalococcoidia bacterium]
MSVIDRPFRGEAATRRRRSLSIPVRRPSALVIILLFAAVAVAGTVPLIQNSDATSTGYALRDLERQRDDLRTQLHGLEGEAAMLGARSRIERDAREQLGMILPVHTIYVQIDVPGPTAGALPVQNLPISSGDARSEGDAPSRWERLLEALKP